MTTKRARGKQREAVVLLLRAGWSTPDIAEVIGWSPQAINAAARREGIPRRQPGNPGYRSDRRIDRARLVRLRERGMTWREIGERLTCHPVYAARLYGKVTQCPVV
jgi:IS30 family transposase